MTLIRCHNRIGSSHEAENRSNQDTEKGNRHRACEVESPTQNAEPLLYYNSRVIWCEIEEHQMPVVGVRMLCVQVFEFHCFSFSLANVKEHATLSASASVDHGVGVKTT